MFCSGFQHSVRPLEIQMQPPCTGEEESQDVYSKCRQDEQSTSTLFIESLVKGKQTL